MGETHVWKTLRGAVRSITNIYSLRGMQDRWNSGHGKPNRWGAKLEEFKTGGRQERRVQVRI